MIWLLGTGNPIEYDQKTTYIIISVACGEPH